MEIEKSIFFLCSIPYLDIILRPSMFLESSISTSNLPKSSKMYLRRYWPPPKWTLPWPSGLSSCSSSCSSEDFISTPGLLFHYYYDYYCYSIFIYLLSLLYSIATLLDQNSSLREKKDLKYNSSSASHYSDVGWLVWVKYLSWYQYGFEALMINQWEGVTNITCPAPPPGLEGSIPCLSTGEQVLNQLNFDTVKQTMLQCTLALYFLTPIIYIQRKLPPLSPFIPSFIPACSS